MTISPIFPVLAFGVALCLAPLVRTLALRTGRFGRAGCDGAVPIPPLGGLAFCLPVLLLFPFYPYLFPAGFWAGAIGMALIGFADDLRPFPPFRKLSLQVAVVAVAVAFGVRLGATDGVLDLLLTGTWLMWMCNAVNVLDMMDGLAAGVGAVAALGLAVLGTIGGVPSSALVAVTLSGALGGFLVYNTHPARLYMGDTGSLFAGFILGGIAVQISRALPQPQGMLCPLLVLGIPCFEAAFLCVIRPSKGRPITRASRDHVAQRLVRKGHSVRGAVGRMYAAGGVLALLGILGAAGPAGISWALFGGAVLLALWIGVRLAGVDMEGDAPL